MILRIRQHKKSLRAYFRFAIRIPFADRLIPRNILWRKVQRDELLTEEALLDARLLQGAEIELLPMRSLFEAAARMSIEFNHPAYDCVHLALAGENKCQFVAADERFLRKLHQGRQRTLRAPL